MGKRYDQERFEEIYVSRRLSELSLPEDFSELVLAQGPEPSAEVLDRIAKKALERIHADNTFSSANKTPLFLWRLRLVAVVLLIGALMVGAWIGPARVWAGLQRVIQMVPGIGLIVREEFPKTLVAAGPVRVETEHGILEVIGFSADEEKTLVHLSLKNVPGYGDDMFTEVTLEQRLEYADSLKEIYLLDGRGQKHYCMQSLGGGGREDGENWVISIRLHFPPIDMSTRRVTLGVPLPGDLEIRVEIPLEKLPENKFPNTVTQNGVTVNASVRFGASTWVFLRITPRESTATGHSYTFTQRYQHWRGAPRGWEILSLRGEDNRWYNGEGSGSTSFQLNYVELSFDKKVHPEEKFVTLNIPALFLTEPGEASVTVPIPEKGGSPAEEVVYFRQFYSEAKLTTYPDTAISMNKEVTLGRFTFTLTRVERVNHQNGDYVRIYLDLGFPGEEVLVDFTLSDEKGFLDKYPREPYWISFSPSTGLLEYIELPLEGREESLIITLEKPVYMVHGPWTFTFPAR